MCNPVTAPLVDQADEIISALAFHRVNGWDRQKQKNYCIDGLVAQKSEQSLEQMVEEYEEFYNRSIVHEIKYWNVDPVVWEDFVIAEYYAVTSMLKGPPLAVPPESVDEDDSNILSWAIYLRNKGGSVQCILNVANHEEAWLITRSINDHFYRDNTNTFPVARIPVHTTTR